MLGKIREVGKGYITEVLGCFYVEEFFLGGR